MHEMQTIVTDVRGVCLSVRPSICHGAKFGGECSVCGSFGAAFAKLLWPLVCFHVSFIFYVFRCFVFCSHILFFRANVTCFLVVLILDGVCLSVTPLQYSEDFLRVGLFYHP